MSESTQNAADAASAESNVEFCPLPQEAFAPDHMRAEQISSMLSLVSGTLAAMTTSGFNAESAQRVCDLLLPATDAIAVAITDTKIILGYAGQDKDLNPTGGPIRTVATHQVLKDGLMRVVRSSSDIGFPVERFIINAAIIVPLDQNNRPIGTLKFYYPGERSITETQLSIAEGFAELLSTQLDAAALEDQRKAAVSMELKMLQSQINPHFLFNTINTITSLIRTDPNKARTLLREFAVFYRSVLEDSNDLIALDREIKQVERYFMFETARFGEERLSLEVNVDPLVREMQVPSFMLQPLVENSVHHAMKSEGTLHVSIDGYIEGDSVIVRVSDDGTGMNEETMRNMLSGSSSRGLGIAVKNVKDRMLNYFGPESRMEIESELGKGTSVSFILKHVTENPYVKTSGLQTIEAN